MKANMRMLKIVCFALLLTDAVGAPDPTDGEDPGKPVKKKGKKGDRT